MVEWTTPLLPFLEVLGSNSVLLSAILTEFFLGIPQTTQAFDIQRTVHRDHKVRHPRCVL